MNHDLAAKLMHIVFESNAAAKPFIRNLSFQLFRAVSLRLHVTLMLGGAVTHFTEDGECVSEEFPPFQHELFIEISRMNVRDVQKQE